MRALREILRSCRPLSVNGPRATAILACPDVALRLSLVVVAVFAVIVPVFAEDGHATQSNSPSGYLSGYATAQTITNH